MHQSHRLAGINEACLDDALDTLDDGIRVVRRSRQYLEAFDRRIALTVALPYREIGEGASNLNANTNHVQVFLQIDRCGCATSANLTRDAALDIRVAGFHALEYA